MSIKHLNPLVIFLFLACTLVLSSCKKDPKKDLIEIEYPLYFPDKMVGETHGVDSLIDRETFEFPTELDGELAKNNTNKSKIVSARLIFMRIQVLDYAYQDSTKYSNLKDISEIYLDIKKTGVGQELIAKKMIPDVRTNAVNLDLEDIELKKYLQADNFAMVVKYKKRRGMLHDMPFVISLKFKITAEPL
ncbi:MAG: hypothetical protein Q8K70_10270 [Bacteroidota bacterium]|nr:hypothetical protein [Bacteroidota bacterium]